MTQPKEGDLRVWWVPQVPMKAFQVPIDTVKEGRKLLDVLAAYDIFQYENNVKPDYANVGGIQRYEEDGEGGYDWFDLPEDQDEMEEVLGHPVEPYDEEFVGHLISANRA